MNANRRHSPLLVCFPLIFTVVAAACGGDSAADSGKPSAAGSNQQASPKIDPVAAGEAKQIFDSLCFTCHGSQGHGDGPGAGALEPKPRSFADIAWQDSVTDAQIEKTIVFGGAAVGKSPMMPAQPQLKGKTEVLAALTKLVRSFRGK